MVWNAQNLYPHHAGNSAAMGSENIAARPAGNVAAQAALNIAARGAGNIAARGARNVAAVAAANIAAMRVAGLEAGLADAGWGDGGGHTGAGNPSGSGFAGGYGPVDRWEYATPTALAPVPWTMDFAIGNGWLAFPVDQRINPHAFDPPLQWQTGDWDPGLRFWTLPFDSQLTEWLQDLDLRSPSVMAAREFAVSRCRTLEPKEHPARKTGWLAQAETGDMPWLQRLIENDPALTGWRMGAVHSGQPVDAGAAWQFINAELVELIDLMRDDRQRYLPELSMQSSHIVPYIVHLLRIDPATRPWTMELMNCGSAIGNLVKMQYKSVYRRVRPSTLCPGLLPPWGPPQHPAFPSGHALVSHLMVLLLLQVEGIAQRFGIFPEQRPVDGASAVQPGIGRPVNLDADILANGAPAYGIDQRSPLLWLAWRIAKGRERLGVHYPSDSAASRKLAAGVCQWCMHADAATPLPTLHRVLALAAAEWPPLVTPPPEPPAG